MLNDFCHALALSQRQGRLHLKPDLDYLHWVCGNHLEEASTGSSNDLPGQADAAILSLEAL
jgi:hypothetical protein